MIGRRWTARIGLEIPSHFFDSAKDVYDYEGRWVRRPGEPVTVRPIR
jgi:hypothetical protein